jgi:hypothetical protein
MIHQTFIVDFNAKSWNVNRIISIYPSKNCNFLGGSKNWDTQIAGWFLHVSTGKSPTKIDDLEVPHGTPISKNLH